MAYNQAIVNALISQFGIERVESFCEIEARKYEIIASSMDEGNEKEEAVYEAVWWQTAKDNITDKINHISKKEEK